MVSGYFYLSRVGKNNKLCVKYIKRLLFKYTIWSLPYICIRVLQMVRYENLFGIIKNCCREFFVEGSFYHFWFSPALIISVLLSTLLFRYKKLMISLSICFYIFGVVGCAYKKLAIKIGYLNYLYSSQNFKTVLRIFLMGFPFFVLGYLLFIIREKAKTNSDNRLLWAIRNKPKMLWIISLAIWLLEIGIVISLGVADNVIITFGLYLFVALTFNLLINYPLKSSSVLATNCRTMSNVCYYIHPLILFVLNVILKLKWMPQTLMFFLVVFISSLCGFFLQRINIKKVRDLIS